ncbi:MAG TPA: cysteine synthase family protein [Candidatus Limnocylindrales bacterium]|nr:cysteine synthase family protein [Candidatus Limnocylindrales bacterium]
MTAYPSLIETIGHTPLVEISRFNTNPRVRLLVKLEGANPTGSVKDRVARYMVEALERDGRLSAHSVILEPSSGNTGIALAMICRLRGYSLTIVMPDNVTRERRQMLSIFGASVVDSPGELGSNGAVDLARRMAAEDSRYVLADQYANPANPKAHYETTGAEIVADCPEISVFVAGLGTGGTLMGAGRRLREHNPSIKIYAAEPMPGEKVQGLRSLEDGFVPEILDPSALDGRFLVTTEESIETLRRLMQTEGIFSGVSSGGVLAVAARIADGMESGVVVALLADGGWKYLSEDLWRRDPDEEELETLNLW